MQELNLSDAEIKSRRGRSNRRKGQLGEREVIKLLQPTVDKVTSELSLDRLDLSRNLSQTRDGGYDIVGLKHYAIEVKFHEKLQVGRWWEQTIDQAKRVQREPLLLYRQNCKTWTARLFLNARIACESKTSKVVADLHVTEFLKYFEKDLFYRIRYELEKQSNQLR